MHRIEQLFSEWVIRHRIAVIVASLVLIAIAGSGVRNLGFTSDYRVYFSPTSPLLLAYNKTEVTYTKSDNIFLALVPKDGDIFNREMLTLVEDLTNDAWQIPFSRRVDSIQNFQNTYAEDDDLVVEDLYSEAESLEPEDFKKIREVALSEPLLNGRIVGIDGKATAINITIQFSGENKEEELRTVVKAARKLIASYQAKYPEIGFHVSGMVFMNGAFVEAGQSDGETLFPISFAIMVIFLVLLLKSLSAVLGVTLVIAFSVLAAMGLGGYAGVLLAPASVVSGQMIMVLAVANSVHMLVVFIFDLQQGKPKLDALAESIRINLQPIFLTSATTIIGFLGMNFSEAQPYKDLGNLVAVGVFASFVLSLTFLPALMSFLPVKVKVGEDSSVKHLKRLSSFVIRHYRSLLVGTFVITALSAIALPLNTSEEQFTKYFDKTVQFRLDSDVSTKVFGGTYQLIYSIPAEGKGGISEPSYLQDLDMFAGWYREQPETVNVYVLTDTMRRLNKNMHNDDPQWYRLPESRELAAQYLLLYEMSLPYGLDLNDQVNVDKSATRVIVTLKELTNNEMIALEERAQIWLKKNVAESFATTGTGALMMFSHLAKTNVKSMMVGSVLALLVISLILIFALRSVKIGVLSLVPNLLPAIIGFGVWGLLYGYVNMGLSVVMSMTLGIVVDDSVHFLSKYLRAKREKGYSTEESISYAFTHVGKALIVSTLVLAAGFGVLMMSHFTMNSDMAKLTTWIIVAALLANFLVLPGLLMKFDRTKPTQERK